MDKRKLSQLIKAEAHRLGFSACGIARAHEVKESKLYLHEWLKDGKQAGMDYMANNFEKRCNPSLLVEGTKSIVCLALNYYPQEKLREDQFQFAYYAYGKDYHEIMKVKLTQLFTYIDTLFPVSGRVFCDTAPILERYWAYQAGLGWIGKNSQLIIPNAGSYFFLGELFLNIDLDYDEPIKSKCGTCHRCLDACPTKALTKPYILDSNRCLSYLTIENKEDISSVFLPMIKNKIYGCDDCQHCCPWNRFSHPHSIADLKPSIRFLSMEKADWRCLDAERYRTLFKGSAVKRAKYEGLKRNIKAAFNADD